MTPWALCLRCGRPLQPRTTDTTDEGFVCSGRYRRTCIRIEDSSYLALEIAHFRGFGWGPERIAAKLGVTSSCVEKRLARASAA